ncbi:MAG: glycosyltransferase family 4 protein [Patescibacteria group bacterium]|nr:glycosyltransferase family 4 protein [Patescibacteria group bacterium]
MSQLKPKVLMIGWEYPPHNSGGLGVACQGITQALAEQNAEIYFTLPYQLKQSLGHMKVINCYDKSWGNENSSLPPFGAYSQSVHQSNDKNLDSHQLRALPQSDIEQKVEEYAQLVEEKVADHENEFDLIHAHDWMSFPAATKLKKKTNKPFIAHVHSTEKDRIPNGYGSNYIEKTEKEGMEIADQIVAVSYYTKRLLIDYYQIDPAKIQVIHNGVFPTKYHKNKSDSFAAKRPIVTFMGRLTNQKGVKYFIKVGRKVLRKIPKALFIVAGSGHLYHELLLQTANQQLTAHVLFSGFVRGVQKDKLLDRSDVFIMPSLSEPFGLVALEAAQRQTPVILSKTSGVSEIMTSAVKVDFWDEDKMAVEVIKFLQDKGYSQQVVARQSQELSQATWSKSAQKLKKIYSQAFF